jgi:hypothetical protein
MESCVGRPFLHGVKVEWQMPANSDPSGSMESPMAVLDRDIAAFEAQRAQLEADHDKSWVVFHDGAFAGAFPDFESAATAAVERFDRGPYLIRQVGAPAAVQLPGGMVFTPAHALSASRI